eukprot:SAG11_NODE_27994_length_326_cov_1.158590_2_plen_32_part_01
MPSIATTAAPSRTMRCGVLYMDDYGMWLDDTI